MERLKNTIKHIYKTKLRALNQMFISCKKQRKIKASLSRKKIIISAVVSKWLCGLTKADINPKLILIAAIKNEIDIIDSFALQALELFDRIIFIDHSSSDKTSEYLTSISKKYPQIEVHSLQMTGYYQSELMTWTANTLLPPTNDNEWVFLLDTDEFLPFKSKTEFQKALKPYNTYPIISMQWLNLVPDSFEKPDLEKNTLRKPANPSIVVKVAFQPKRLRKYSYIIAQGNHGITNTEINKNMHAKIAFPLFHIPIRSRTQIINKIVGFRKQFEVMEHNGTVVHSNHYNPIFDLAQQYNYSDDVLAYMTIHYGIDNFAEIIDHYLPGAGRNNLSEADLQFITAKSILCDKYSILPSKTYAETYNNIAPQASDLPAQVIKFNPMDKTFNITARNEA